MSTTFRDWHRQRGVTLVEALVAVALLALVVIAFLSALDVSARVAKVQGNISDMTENVRFSIAALVREAREVGTGGLPIVAPDASGALAPLAIAVEDNVTSHATLGGRQPLDGTDILHLRGVFESDLYDIPGGSVSLSGSTGAVVIPGISPVTGNPQELANPAPPQGHALLIGLQTPLDIPSGLSAGGVRHYSGYRVVIVDSAAVTGTPPNDSMAVTFHTQGAETALKYNPGGSFVAFSTGFAYSAGFLNDYQYFIANNGVGEPSLYRWDSFSTAAEELVPNISNLQVALACDWDRNGQIQGNEWFLTAANATLPTGSQMDAFVGARISVVARSQDPDLSWMERVTTMPEDGVALSGAALKYRHRVITVAVAPRSHPPLEDS